MGTAFPRVPPRNDPCLGIFIDADLSMRSHVQRTVAGCFAILRQLHSIRQSVPSSVFQTLAVALVLSKLDYGNATLAGLPANLLNRLHGTAPRYLSDLLHRVSDVTSKCRLRSSTFSELVIPLSRLVTVGDVHLLLLAPGSGTLCLRTLHLRRLYWCSDEN